MKIGRNEPCPCGSGKKFKQCCLGKDQDIGPAGLIPSPNAFLKPIPVGATAAQSRSPQTKMPPAPPKSAPPKPAPPSDPLMEAIDARWNEFESAKPADRPAIFLTTLDSPELMDEQMAFDMLDKIYMQSVDSNDRDQIDGLIEQLRVRLPKVYAENRQYYLDWTIGHALVNRQFERIPEMARELAETAGKEPDQFLRVIHQLAYHGQLRTLADACRIAWPLIEKNSEIWSKGTFARWGAECALFELLEHSPDIDGSAPEVIDQIRFFNKAVQAGQLSSYVAQLNGQEQLEWSLGDFSFERQEETRVEDRWDEDEDEEEDEEEEYEGEDEDDEEGEEEDTERLATVESTPLGKLLTQFMGYAYRHEGVPYVKMILVRENIAQYLLERASGDLQERASSIEEFMTPRGKRKPRRAPPRPANILCPDPETLEFYLGSLLRALVWRFYDAAAMFELIPAWLRFLESQKLLAPTQVIATIEALRPLHARMLKLWETHRTDPILAENCRQWPEPVNTIPSAG